MLVERGAGAVWREHLLAVLLASLSYLLVIAGQYVTIQKAVGSGISVPDSSSGELIRRYGASLGVALGLLAILLDLPSNLPRIGVVDCQNIREEEAIATSFLHLDS